MIDPLIENYDELRQSRDWSWDQMADEVERVDPRMAAELRKQDAGKARKAAEPTAPADPDAPPKKRATPPKKRTAPAKPSTAAKK